VGVLDSGVVGLALAVAAASALGYLRSRAQRHADRIAFGAAQRRAARALAAGRRLTQSAQGAVEQVGDALIAALLELAPELDAILLFEQDADTLLCTRAHGDRLAYFAGTRLARGDAAALPARALATGHRVALGEPGTRAFHPADASALAVPLAPAHGRPGALYVASAQALAPDAIDAIVALAEQAGFALALARERDDDRRRAEYDGLTGLLTPRALRERLTARLEAARFAPDARLALAFVDTDRFKEYNDTRGHAAGDALLRDIAELLRGALRRDGDMAARNGGDEFCVVFAACEKSDALRRAEELRAAIAGLGPVSASIGVAAFPVDARTANDLLARADAAMYHAKRSGRDAVAFADAGAFSRLDVTTAPA
jgi:diguanylate cyclase (GGDEF)-like protein